MPYAGRSRQPKQGFRDVLKLWHAMEDENGVYVILGAEAQAHIHYAMPVKGGLYDFMNYAGQVEEHRQAYRHGASGTSALSSGEFLSGFRRGDRLKPVVTLVIYFGVSEWDGPICLHDMLDDANPELLSFVPNYRINLIAPAHIPEGDFGKFHTDFGRVMEFIKYSQDKEKLSRAVNRDARYHAMEVDSYELIRLATNTDLVADVKEERVDMCLALEQMKQESLQQGIQQGIQQDMQKGEYTATIRHLRTLMDSLGFDTIRAMDALGIPQQERSRYEEMMKS